MCGNSCWCRRCLQSTLGIMQSLAEYPSQFQGQTGASKLFFPDTSCLSQAGAATCQL